jgi:hypothetical protein
MHAQCTVIQQQSNHIPVASLLPSTVLSTLATSQPIKQLITSTLVKNYKFSCLTNRSLGYMYRAELAKVQQQFKVEHGRGYININYPHLPFTDSLLVIEHSFGQS